MISPNQVSRVAGLFGGMGATPDPAVPADPRQQNAMQAAGVTNPLLQQFGRSVAGLFGKADQMASPMQQMNRAIQSVKDPSSYEGKLKIAQAVMQIDPMQGTQLLQAAEKTRLLDQQKKEKLLLEQKQRELLAGQATALGREGLAKRIRLGGEPIAPLAEELNTAQAEKAASINKRKTFETLATNAGKTDLLSDVQSGQYDDLTVSEFKGELSGRDANLEEVVSIETGEISYARVDEQGKMFDPKTSSWKEPSELGFRPFVTGRTAEDVAAEKAASGETSSEAARQAMIGGSLANLSRIDELLFDTKEVDGQQVIDYGNVNWTNILNAKMGTPKTQGRSLNVLLKSAFEAQLRAETGAAAPDSEVKRLTERLSPHPFDSVSTIKLKRAILEQFLSGAYGKMFPSVKDPAQLAGLIADAALRDLGKVPEQSGTEDIDINSMTAEQIRKMLTGQGAL